MSDVLKYAAELTEFINLLKASKFINLPSDTKRKAEEVEKFVEIMFDRFCPYRIGDRVQLKRAPVITEKTSWGWLGSKHFLIKGAKATVKTTEFRKGEFYFLLIFDDESWVDTKGRVIPVKENSGYSFVESMLEPASIIERIKSDE